MQEDRAHVSLQVNTVQVERERTNTRSSGRTNAWELYQLLWILWKDAAGLRNCLSSSMHGQSTTVVAQALPFFKHVRRRCGGQRINRWEALQPSLPAAIYTADLRLLKHNLRNPDSIRVIRATPRQIAIQLATFLGYELDKCTQFRREF